MFKKKSSNRAIKIENQLLSTVHYYDRKQNPGQADKFSVSRIPGFNAVRFLR